jgi:hypothetical protein
MSASAPAFAKLHLPSVEEYQSRKVALISGLYMRLHRY